MLPPELNSAARLIKRFDKAKSRRNSAWWSLMEDCYSYAAPQRETFFEYSPGQEKNAEVYDDTAVIGLQTFASRMQQAIVPPWQQFAKLVPGESLTKEESDSTINFNGEEKTLSEALEEITDTVFSYIHRSNFASKSYEAFIDVGISTGVMTCDYDPDEDELVFNAIPLPEVFLEAGPRGTLNTVWRESDIEVGLIKQLWPGSKISPKVEEAIKKDAGEKIKIVEGFVYNPDDKNTYYIVINKGEKGIIFHQADEVSPIIAFRGMVVPGENYGRGPVMQVLPSIRTLNLVKEFELTSGAIAASGVWTATDDGTFNPYTVQIAPGIVIPVASNDTRSPSIRPLEMNFNFQFSQIKADELEQTINRVLFANPIGDIDDPTKTATEIMIRRQLDLQEQIAFFSRIQTELVDQLMNRVIHVLKREGQIPEIKIDGKSIALKHVSPVAMAMDLEDVQKLTQAVQMSSIAGQELMLLGLKMEDIPGFIAEKLGVDPSLRRSDTDATELKKLAAQMLAQMQQAREAPVA